MLTKRNKVVLILSAVFVLMALVFLALGFALSGNDLLAWFTSTTAYIIYIVFGLYILLIVFIYVSDYIRRL